MFERNYDTWYSESWTTIEEGNEDKLKLVKGFNTIQEGMGDNMPKNKTEASHVLDEFSIQ